MSLIPATAVPFTGEDFTIDQSLRLDADTDAILTRTPASAGNRRTWTFSCWAKRGKLGRNSGLLGTPETNAAGGDGGKMFRLKFDSGDSIGVYSDNASYLQVESTAKYRDASAWYHIVLAMDTTQGTATNRMKLYVNGTQITDFGTANYPAQNLDTGINYTHEHRVGKGYSTNEIHDGYLAEVHFIDGTAVAATSFGETGDYGEWKPIEYSGTYGTNGFYLPFKNDYEVEGFSTTLYQGAGAVDTYVGGVGFKPDLVWLKNRTTSDQGWSFDTIRGKLGLMLPATTAESNPGNSFHNFDNDGFTVGTANDQITRSGNNYVAWAWDMGGGSYGIPTTVSAVGTAQHSTAQAKIGASSILLDGNSDYISVTANHESYNILSGDFTMEGWFYFNQMTDNRGIMAIGTSNWKLGVRFSGSGLQVKGETASLSGIDAVSSSTHGMSTGEWNHIAIMRRNSTTTLYVNGVDKGTSSDVYDVESSDIRLGHYYESPNYMYGYIDEVRLSNVARYSGNFTPSTTAFSNDANTLFLLHSDTSNGSTTFVDSSGATKNTTGSIDSYVKASTTYGQSIVTATMPGSGTGVSMGHGLNSKPDMIILKSRSETAPWYVWHKDLASETQSYLKLDNSAVAANSSVWNNTAPTSSVFSTLSNYSIGNSNKAIAYCFHSVTGYSSIGSFTGNGDSRSTAITINCGFKPAFIIMKVADASSNRDWYIWDDTRSNPIAKHLRPNLDNIEAGEAGKIEFTSTGVSITTNDDELNSNGDKTIYMAFADKREYAYWLDQSGNNNDWTSNSLTESDIMVDSPTNNFCVMNPLSPNRTNLTFSEGNLKLAGWDTGFFGTMGVSSGKWYWEMHSTNASGNALNTSAIGIVHSTALHDTVDGSSNSGFNGFGGIDKGRGYYGYDGNKLDASSTVSYGDAFVTGDIIGVALNLDDDEITFYKNNVSQGVAFTSLGSGDWFPLWQNWTGSVGVMNFGQDSSFAGIQTPQGNQDTNEIGDFYYTPPTNFLALCTSNLPEPAVIPSEYFNTILYTGNNADDRAMTGVGFQPDLLWIKARSLAYSHRLLDAIREAPNVLNSNSTNAENPNETDGVKSIDSDGFTLGTSNGLNQSSNTFAAWNWKAGGSGSANTDGNMAETVTVSANADAGFSIVTYTGDGAVATVGHGLSKAPELIMVKQRNAAQDWIVYANMPAGGAMDETDFLNLNDNGAAGDEIDYWNDTEATADVFTLGTGSHVNDDDDTYVAYCWHSVEGYSKVSFYIGNGNADGVFIYTGFRPAFVLVKHAATAMAWWVWDNKRDIDNFATNVIQPNDSAAEATGHDIDFVSNGFKLRDSVADINHANRTFIYLAFAETPFKYANAR